MSTLRNNLIRTCSECDREFDLLNEVDYNEWHYGHDCEPAPRPRTARCETCDDKYEAGGWYDDGRCERHRS